MEIATTVASIISAYGNGRDCLKRMTGQKLKRKGRAATLPEKEAWLRDSLHHRPREIQDSYDRSVARLGSKFRIGDSIAHTSLAHTLLVLNSGLINLISNALSGDPKKYDATKMSLLSLSEGAAAESLAALSQLSLRIVNPPRPQRTLKAPSHAQEPAPKDQKRPQALKMSDALKIFEPQKKRPGPAPLLVRGGWVRPKTSSVVSSSSSKSDKTITSTQHQRSRSESVVPTSASPKKHSRSQSSTPGHSSSVPTLMRPEQLHQRAFSESHAPQRQPSMLLVPSDFFRPLSGEPQSYANFAPPPRPPKVPLHSRPDPSPRARPTSAATFMTSSTKIGEIPDPHFHRPSYTIEEQAHDPRLVQYLTSPKPVVPQEEPRRKGRGFKFWKREETRQPLSAF